MVDDVGGIFRQTLSPGRARRAVPRRAAHSGEVVQSEDLKTSVESAPWCLQSALELTYDTNISTTSAPTR